MRLIVLYGRGLALAVVGDLSRGREREGAWTCDRSAIDAGGWLGWTVSVIRDGSRTRTRLDRHRLVYASRSRLRDSMTQFKHDVQADCA